MPKWLKPSDEKKWDKAKKIVEDNNDKSQSKFKDRDWGLTTHIMQNMKHKKKKKTKKKADEIPLTMHKLATSVVIEPFEPLIQKAIEAIDKVQPGYFSGVTKVIVEQALTGGDPFHYGKVESDKPNTIFINMSAVRSAIAGATDEDEKSRSIAGILAHEMGHLKAKMQGGEGPAVSEEHRILDLLSKKSSEDIRSLIRIANILDIEGFSRNASIIDEKLDNMSGFNKQAYANTYINPDDVADTILRIIYHFTQKVRPEAQRNYVINFAEKLRKIDELAMSTKKKNPGAGIGASISIIKNLLGGHNRMEVNKILNRVLRGMSQI